MPWRADGRATAAAAVPPVVAGNGEKTEKVIQEEPERSQIPLPHPESSVSMRVLPTVPGHGRHVTFPSR